MNKVFHYINGKEHVGSSDRFGDVFNPANGEKIREVNLANKDDVKLAIECAVKAGKEWAATPSLTRSRVLFKFKDSVKPIIAELQVIIIHTSPEHFQLIFWWVKNGLLPVPLV